MEKLNEIIVGNFPLSGQYNDQDTHRMVAKLMPCVLNEIKVRPVLVEQQPVQVEDKPRIWVIEGGKK